MTTGMERGCTECGEPEPGSIWMGPNDEALCDECKTRRGTNMDLNDYANDCAEANEQWWMDLETGTRLDRNKGEMFMLMVSEISEAMEGARKNLMDDKLPHRSMEEVELVDCLIRIFDYAGNMGLDLESAYTVPTRRVGARRGGCAATWMPAATGSQPFRKAPYYRS